MEHAARAAYEAFCAAIGEGLSPEEQLRILTIAVPWEDLPQRMVDAWTAAAKAAIARRNTALANRECL